MIFVLNYEVPPKDLKISNCSINNSNVTISSYQMIKKKNRYKKDITKLQENSENFQFKFLIANYFMK
jgi:hypothetical protein